MLNFLKYKPAMLWLILPVIGCVLMIAQVELSRANMLKWRVQTQGYDPRDILRGRYLRIRLDMAAHGMPEQDRNFVGVCITPHTAKPAIAGAYVPVITKYVKGAGCATRLSSIAASEAVHRRLRFYVPENHAKQLERPFFADKDKHTTQAIVGFDNSGNVILHDMLIDGLLWKDWLKKTGHP